MWLLKNRTQNGMAAPRADSTRAKHLLWLSNPVHVVQLKSAPNMIVASRHYNNRLYHVIFVVFRCSRDSGVYEPSCVSKSQL